jgi:uncharacterized protein (TIGR00725 family)
MSDHRKPLVTIAGSGHLRDGDPREALAEATGRALIEAGYRLLTGGRGGVMEAACRGARSAPTHQPGDIIGVLPGHDAADANPWVDVVLPTGLGHLRNGIVAHADALVAIGGGAGTLSEVALAWVWDRRIVSFRTEGWSGRLADTRLDSRVRFADDSDDRVYGVDRPSEAIQALDRWFRVPPR